MSLKLHGTSDLRQVAWTVEIVELSQPWETSLSTLKRPRVGSTDDLNAQKPEFPKPFPEMRITDNDENTLFLVL